MNKLFKKLCPIAAVLCLVLCLGGAVGVLQNASGEPLWQAAGVFFIGVSIFVFFTLIALPLLSAEADTKTTKYNKDKTARKPQKGKNNKTNKTSSNNSSNKKSTGGDKPQKPQAAENKDTAEKSKDENKGDDGIKRDTGEQINGDSGPVTLYIANLTEEVSELDIREEFGVFGAVKSVKIVADKETGVSKGYAFVEMANKAEADLAMEDINGQEIKGNQVKVSYARRKKRGKRNNNKKQN